MASRIKEEEKNERIIRGLLKLPGNRRCINCNSLGPQYICTNFWTFVCTTCSGIHREFTHRVKSISMAKFTSQEVLALQGGGNERARQIYFKEWDLQRLSSPDSSNTGKLRDFIKHVYVDERYIGDGILQKSSSGKTVGSEDLHGGGSKSPGYGDTYVRRYSEGSRPGGRSGERFGEIYGERSPSYEKGSVQYNDSRSSSNSEVINDWRRDDRFANGRSTEEQRFSDGNYKVGGRSPDSQTNASSSSSPVARPVRDILGENVPLRIMKPPKTGSIEVANTALQNQSRVGSGSLESRKDPAEPKMESLIDFDSEPSHVPSSTPQQQENVTAQSTSEGPNNLSADNWASFDFGSTTSSSNVPSSTKSLESALSDLSVLTQPSITPPRGDGLGKDVSAVSQNWMNPPPQFTPSIVQSSLQPTSSSLVSTGLPVPSTASSETRKALPEDLFAMTYHGFPPQNQGWHGGRPGVHDPFMTGLNPGFQQPSGTFNPFDFSRRAMAPYAFPSMTSFQPALPHLPPQASLPHHLNPNWTQPSFGLPPPIPVASTFPQPPRPYMSEQLPGGSMYSDVQIMSSTFQSTPNSSHSASRNPFA